MQLPDSESALLWNLIYQRAQPTLAAEELLSLPPLWGSRVDPIFDDLLPYYWGFSQMGARMPRLDHVLDMVDGPGPKTEVDLFLLGESGACAYRGKAHGRMWGGAVGTAQENVPRFTMNPRRLVADIGHRRNRCFPTCSISGSSPSEMIRHRCANRHYQLGRTALVGSELAKELNRRLHLWLILPRSRWRYLRRDWIDFSDRIGNDSLWRRLRVLAWEDVISLAKPPSNMQIPP